MGGFMQYSQRLGEAGRNDRRSMRGAFRPGLLPTLALSTASAVVLLLLWRRLSLNTWRQAPGLVLLCLLAWVVLSSLFNTGSAKDLAYWLKIVGLIVFYVFAVASFVRQSWGNRAGAVGALDVQRVR
mgnify:CR=1 FL=1